MLLINLTDTDERLISASTAASEVVELDEMLIGENDVMQMRPVEDGITIPAGDNPSGFLPTKYGSSGFLNIE